MKVGAEISHMSWLLYVTAFQRQKSDAVLGERLELKEHRGSLWPPSLCWFRTVPYAPWEAAVHQDTNIGYKWAVVTYQLSSVKEQQRRKPVGSNGMDNLEAIQIKL